MCEAGLSINEIQVQSGHSNLKTLLEYIQHSPQRIRQSYEKVFEDTPKIQPKTTENEKVDTDYYKRIAVQKYLDGEINEDMLHSMLDGLKDTKQEIRKNRDISYL